MMRNFHLSLVHIYGPQQIGVNIPEFSTRQQEITHYMLRGDSANKIAYKLKLSKRTIENYIEIIKDKLGCFSKAELIRKLLEIESINAR